MAGKRWTPEEIEFLKSHYLIIGSDRVATEIGRTIGAVEAQWHRLIHGRYSEGPWTSQDITYLKANYREVEYKEIARRLGKTEGAVRNKCYSIGLRKKADDWTAEDIRILKDHYEQEIVNLDELEKLLGRNKTNISRKARELDLTNQSRPKSLYLRKIIARKSRNWHKTHEHPRGFSGHKHTKEAKRKIAKKSREAWRNPNSELNSEELKQRRSEIMAERQRNGIMRNLYSRGKQGKRDDLGGLYVRSAWEANYARYLNWLVQIGEIKDWEYEPDTFEFHKIKRGSRFYTPDFKIFNVDDSIEYHEVKGWMDQKSKTKLKRMAKYYPDIPIKVIDADAYKALEKDVCRFILFWE